MQTFSIVKKEVHVSKRFKIKAKVIVGYQRGAHRILRDGCIVIDDSKIVYVGETFDGPVDDVINASDRVVTPGFINCHTHLAGSPLDKSFIEDRGGRQFYLSGLPAMLPTRAAAMDQAAREACVDYSMAELIRTGTTTVMEIGLLGDYVAGAAERAGLRAYVAENYCSGRWLTRDGKKIDYEWDEPAGITNFHRAVDFVAQIDGRGNGRVRGFLSPAQVDTCTEELLRLSRQASDDLGVPLALHTSQSVFEFQEIVQRHGMTPLEWLESIDFLSEWNILGHVLFIAGHSWVQFAGDDLSILTRNGVSVAHAPWVFARRGLAMESLPDYLDAGVNVCLGTDTSPQSMIEALRYAAVIGKIMIRETEKATAADVFNAATLNAATMLHRDDLGRIEPGAKADLLFWDVSSMFMIPLRDPIKNIVYNATPEDLKDVMIDGQWVMQDRRILHIDEPAVIKNLQAAGERMWSAMGPGHWAGWSADKISPQTFRPFKA